MTRIRYLPVEVDDTIENGNAIVLNKKPPKGLKKGEIMLRLRDQLDDMKALLEFIDSRTKKPEEKKPEEPKEKKYTFAELCFWVMFLGLPVTIAELYLLGHVGEWMKTLSIH